MDTRKQIRTPTQKPKRPNSYKVLLIFKQISTSICHFMLAAAYTRVDQSTYA